MDHVTVPTPRDGDTAPIDRSRRNYRHIRVLRWTFRREHEAVVCELSLTGEDREYKNYASRRSGTRRAGRSNASTMP